MVAPQTLPLAKCQNVPPRQTPPLAKSQNVPPPKTPPVPRPAALAKNTTSSNGKKTNTTNK